MNGSIKLFLHSRDIKYTWWRNISHIDWSYSYVSRTHFHWSRWKPMVSIKAN